MNSNWFKDLRQLWVQWSKQCCWKRSLQIRSGPCLSAPLSWDVPSEGSHPEGSSLSALKPLCCSTNQPCGQSTRRSSETLGLRERLGQPLDAPEPAIPTPATSWLWPHSRARARTVQPSPLWIPTQQKTVGNNKSIVVVLSLRVPWQWDNG